MNLAFFLGSTCWCSFPKDDSLDFLLSRLSNLGSVQEATEMVLQNKFQSNAAHIIYVIYSSMSNHPCMCTHTHTQTHTDGWELKGTMQHIQNGIAVEIHTKLYISDNTGVTTARCQSNLSCLYSVNFFSKNTRQDTIHNVSYEDRHTKRKASWQTHAHTFTVWNSDRNTLQNRQTNRQTHTDTYTQG